MTTRNLADIKTDPELYADLVKVLAPRPVPTMQEVWNVAATAMKLAYEVLRLGYGDRVTPNEVREAFESIAGCVVDGSEHMDKAPSTKA